MLTSTNNRIDSFWSTVLRCSPEEMHSQLPLIICSNSKWLKSNNLMVFQRHDAQPIILLQQNRFKFTQSSLIASLSANILQDPNKLCSALGLEKAAEVGGPWILNYADKEDLIDAPITNTRRIEGKDLEAMESIQRDVDEKIWQDAGSDILEGPVFGSFMAERLCSLASYVIWSYENPTIGHRISDLANINVITHSALRSRGFAQSAVLALALFALNSGLIPQYQTLESNRSSQAVAKALGFIQFARYYFLRISSE